jgi:hypothetical protein
MTTGRHRAGHDADAIVSGDPHVLGAALSKL